MEQVDFEEQAKVGECPTCRVQRGAIQVTIEADDNKFKEYMEKVAEGIRDMQDRGKQL